MKELRELSRRENVGALDALIAIVIGEHDVEGQTYGRAFLLRIKLQSSASLTVFSHHAHDAHAALDSLFA